MKIDLKFLNAYQEKGFALLPFPEQLRLKMIRYIENYVRELGSSYIGEEKAKNAPLEEIALSIPDDDWTHKMTRAFRIFPKNLGADLFRWAHENIGIRIGMTRSAVNVVYPAELVTNPKLDDQSLAIYWRCVRPGKPDAGRPHRDASFWELENADGFDPKIPFPYDYLKDCYKIWIPIKGCTPLTTLQVIPGSHKIDIPTTIQQTEYGRRPSIAASWLDQREAQFISPIELSQGSAIVFDMNTVHRGPAHKNTELRISAELCLVAK